MIFPCKGYILIKRLFLLFFALLFFPGLLSASDRKPGVLLLPFQDRSDHRVFPASEVYLEIIRKSLYSILSDDEKIVLMNKAYSGVSGITNDEKVSFGESADILILGNYKLTGKVQSPVITLTMTVTILPENRIVEKIYDLQTDRRIFDGIDSLGSELIYILNGIRLPETPVVPPPVKKQMEIVDTPSYPVLTISNIQISNSLYGFYLNDTLLYTISNAGFAAEEILRPGVDYTAKLVRLPVGTEAVSRNYRLTEHERAEFNYIPNGTVRLGALRNKEQWKKYSFQINGMNALEKSVLSNIPADLSYTLVVKDQKNQTALTQKFYLTNGGTVEVNPSLKTVTGLHGLVYKADETFAGIGVIFLFTRYLWLEGGCGISGIPGNGGSPNSFLLFPYASVGYYLWNDMLYPFRAGAGLTYRTWINPTGDGAAINPNDPLYRSVYSSFGVFIIAEAFGFFIRPGVLYDFSKIRTEICFGLKF